MDGTVKRLREDQVKKDQEDRSDGSTFVRRTYPRLRVRGEGIYTIRLERFEFPLLELAYGGFSIRDLKNCGADPWIQQNAELICAGQHCDCRVVLSWTNGEVKGFSFVHTTGTRSLRFLQAIVEPLQDGAMLRGLDDRSDCAPPFNEGDWQVLRCGDLDLCLDYDASGDLRAGHLRFSRPSGPVDIAWQGGRVSVTGAPVEQPDRFAPVSDPVALRRGLHLLVGAAANAGVGGLDDWIRVQSTMF